ncbi:helix-turn-helix domain-containing protein [Candidatus Phytoplasma melaleucae]|uniref:Helix-turn-helix domain-containing protein n=1 Tax=Candidatus Phytoplasma melaleucae TaxID=2982630 RepID=A0ABT9DD75_9MOLU|nr:helix-turn-helix domain-containing protein ['Melaleuca sp.' phytoplasma]MDO8168020.1 helix-turn-helix domain-containing protein ['Melaleuca sp.' phytoplasma]MDV3205458.1 helix-turn-helix domain-containing protein [Weeping tea tree witches'-broom phytoplasma]
MDIGIKIRNLRLQHKLTQRELSIKINVTSGYISQIENNLISPSLKTLCLLLDVFKTNISAFFKQENHNIPLIIKKEDYLIKNNQNTKNKTYHILHNYQTHKIEPMIIDIQPEGQIEFGTKTIKNEFFLVLEGEIILVLKKLHYLLNKEDAFYIPVNQEYHLFNNHKKNKTKILQIIIY